MIYRNQDRNSRQTPRGRKWSIGQGVMCFLACFPWVAWLSVLPAQWSMSSHINQQLRIHPIDMPADCCDRGNASVEIYSSLACLALCQADKNYYRSWSRMVSTIPRVSGDIVSPRSVTDWTHLPLVRMERKCCVMGRNMLHLSQSSVRKEIAEDLPM